MRALTPRTVLLAALLLLTGVAVGCQDSTAKLQEHLSRGETYFEEEKFAEAIIEYKSALQIDPNQAEAHWGLARAYLGERKLREAFWELQETVRLDPANLEAKLQYGRYLLFGKESDLEEAVSRANEILDAEPGRWEAMVLKGRALDALKRFDEALEAYQAAVDTAPEEGAPLLQLANFHRQRGNREAAEPVYRKLTEVKPVFQSWAALAGFLGADRKRDQEAEYAYRSALEVAEPAQRVAAHAVLANFFYSRERFAEAEQVLRDGLAEDPENLDLIYALARFHNAQGDPEKAEAMIQEATRARPDDVAPYLALSAFRSRQGDLDGALEAAEQAMQADTESTVARLRKAEVLVDIGFQREQREQILQGRAIVDAVLSGDPGNPEGLFVKGKLDVAEGKLDEAVASLRRALDGRPDWAQAHFLLGSALFLQRDVNGARAAVSRALEIDGTLIEAQRVLARVHAASGEDELAVEVGRRVLEKRPDDHKLRIQVAQSLVRLGRNDEGAASLSAIPEEARDAEAHYAIGRVHFLDGDRVKARASFLAAAEQEPNRYEILRSLLDLDLRENRLAESAQRIRAASSQNPDDARLAQLVGLVALYAGDASSAEASFRRAIELDPNDLGGYENLARYLLVTGRPKEVLETYEKALASNPSSGTLHLIVGSLYELQSRTEDAMARYEDAVRLDPGLAVAKNNLAYLLTETGGDLDRALELAQEAKELLPDNPNAADTLGWVLYKKRVPSAAIGYLKEAERGLRPEDPQMGTVRHHLAMAYAANKQPKEARDVLQRALRDLESLNQAAGEERPEPAWAADVRAMLKRLESPALQLQSPSPTAREG